MTDPVHRKSMIVRLISIILILLALAIVAFLLFSPIKPRPTAAEYIDRYNKTAEEQGIRDRLGTEPTDLAAGSTHYQLQAAGMTLNLAYDPAGYVTGIALSDDTSRSPEAGWQLLSAQDIRNQLFLAIYATDPELTIAGLYRTFDQVGIDLDQPLNRQAAGTRVASADGLNLTLTHDASHFTLSVQLDMIEE